MNQLHLLIIKLSQSARKCDSIVNHKSIFNKSIFKENPYLGISYSLINAAIKESH